MEVILLQKIRNLGGLGDTVSVRAGFGRNYLFPRGMALPSTRANQEFFEARREQLQRASQEREERARGRAAQLADKSFTIPMRASDEGRLFGSVGPLEVVEAVTKEGYELDSKEVTLVEGTVRQTGYYTAELTLYANVICEIEIVVAQMTDMGINMPTRLTGAADTQEAPADEELEGDMVKDAGEPADDSATEADAPIGEGEDD